jgi:hypothetical protein
MFVSGNDNLEVIALTDSDRDFIIRDFKNDTRVDLI